MIDYHIHTKRCGHAQGEMADYVRHARTLSLEEIGFADHLPLLFKQDPTLTMSLEELDEYIQAVEQIKNEFPDILIKSGIEADYLPGFEENTSRILKSYNFDFVIGSVHFIDGWGFDDSRYIDGYKDWDLFELYARYFDLVAEAASTGLFDIIGHLDLIKKYNFRPESDIAPLVEKALSAIKEAGVAVEINTAGLRKPVGEVYPSLDIIKLCFKANIPITFGSDAHRPEEVGKDFDIALAYAKEAGYDRVVVFNKRVPQYISLR
ncbi:MAG: histidinol-phosphatase HisJ [Firmicutes bacterium]|nr:histidinol-phosphatase HisJ [Bacillota bacterium]